MVQSRRLKIESWIGGSPKKTMPKTNIPNIPREDSTWLNNLYVPDATVCMLAIYWNIHYSMSTAFLEMLIQHLYVTVSWIRLLLALPFWCILSPLRQDRIELKFWCRCQTLRRCRREDVSKQDFWENGLFHCLVSRRKILILRMIQNWFRDNLPVSHWLKFFFLRSRLCESFIVTRVKNLIPSNGESSKRSRCCKPFFTAGLRVKRKPQALEEWYRPWIPTMVNDVFFPWMKFALDLTVKTDLPYGFI